MTDTVTDTIACIGKNLLTLSIGIVICPILSDTIAFVTKKFAYTYDGFIRLKGTVPWDFFIVFFLIGLLYVGPRFQG